MGLTYLFCDACGHEKSAHFFGQCNDFYSGMGPSDNMDVWEEPCDCAGYVPLYEQEDHDEVYEWG